MYSASLPQSEYIDVTADVSQTTLWFDQEENTHHTPVDLNLLIKVRLRNKLFLLILNPLDRSFRMISNEVWEEREARPVILC